MLFQDVNASKVRHSDPGNICIMPLPKHILLLPPEELCQKTRPVGHVPFWSKPGLAYGLEVSPAVQSPQNL